MQLEYDDDWLRRLAEDPDVRSSEWDEDVTRSYRKKIQILTAATDERDLAALRGLRFKKLRGGYRGKYSIRLNDQYRLILRFHTEPTGRVVTVVELVDYH